MAVSRRSRIAHGANISAPRQKTSGVKGEDARDTEHQHEGKKNALSYSPKARLMEIERRIRFLAIEN